MKGRFQPRCLPMAIGSLPHTDVARACDVVLENTPQIVHWPLLPSLSFLEELVTRDTEGMPCLVVDHEAQRVYCDTERDLDGALAGFYEHYLAADLDYFAVSAGYSRGVAAMRDRLATLPEPLVLRCNVTGPVTFGLKIVDQTGRSIFYHDHLRDAAIKLLAMKTRWQVRELRRAAPGALPMVLFAEPYLQAYGSAFTAIGRDEVLASLDECFSAADALVCLHCCGNTDWAMLLSSRADVISLDAYTCDESFALYPEDVARFLDRGGLIAWGIVPTSDAAAAETAESLVARLEAAWQRLMAKDIDREVLVASALITPSCGLATLTVPLAERVYRLTRDVSALLRARYCGAA